jgi:hypothetical protein
MANYGQIGGHGPFMYFDLRSPANIYYCWGRNNSTDLVLESVSQLSENRIQKRKLIEIPPDNEKLSELYHLSVIQYQIRKEAYNYYANLQKNVTQTSGLFSPVPSEMRGNIRCLTHPEIPVIGYIEVSVPSTKEQYMPDLIQVYEPPERRCSASITPLANYANYSIYSFAEPGSTLPTLYAPTRCVDCTSRGTKNKPAFWPTDHV